jgi:hypothetical protein
MTAAVSLAVQGGRWVRVAELGGLLREDEVVDEMRGGKVETAGGMTCGADRGGRMTSAATTIFRTVFRPARPGTTGGV